MTDVNYADRITFVTADQVMEVDISDLSFDEPGPVEALYGAVEQAVEASGQRWFFLVNYRNCRILNEAWITFAYCGKRANRTYSLGTARYAASAETGDVILERSLREDFDPSLFPSRETALSHLRNLRRDYRCADFAAAIRLPATTPTGAYAQRVTFFPELQVMECDFSDMTFERAEQVHAFYDVVDRKLAESGTRWYFLVNYRHCAILPDAWFSFASRGKQANLAYSLGSARFDTDRAVGQSIARDARKEDFDPSLFGSREAALARIAELRAGAA